MSFLEFTVGEGLSLDQMFIFDKTALYYRYCLLPKTNVFAAFKITADGRKRSKDRVTPGACSNYRLQVPSSKFQVASYKLQVASCKLQVTCYRLQVASCKLQVACCMLKVEPNSHSILEFFSRNLFELFLQFS